MDNENDLDPLGVDDEAELDMDDSIFDEDDALFDEEGFGEDEYAAEDWGEYEEEPLGEGDESPVKKKLKLNPVTIGGGIVAVLVVLYMMGGGGQPQPQPQAPATESPAQQQASTNPTNLDVIYSGQAGKKVEKMPVKGKGGLLYDEQALAEIEKVKEQYVFEEHIIESDEDFGSPEVSVVDNPPMPAPMNSGEVLTPLLDTDPVVFDETDTLKQDEKIAGSDDTLSAEAATGWENNTPRMPTERADLAAGVDLSVINQKLEQISERLLAIEEASITKGELSVIGEKVKTLELGLKEVTSRLDAGSVSEQKKEVKASSVKKQSFQKASESSSVPVAPRKPPAPEPEKEWVLKAAQPGSALVSARGSEEIIALRVGDNLPGIGEIQVITQQNGAWAVIGSQGSILQ